MQSKETFLLSDIGLMRQLIRQFFTRRQTRKLLLNLSPEQHKDLGLTGVIQSQSPDLVLLNPPW